MIIIVIDTRGKKHHIYRDASSLLERQEALEEFLSGIKKGEWYADVEGNVISPVHILSFTVER